MASSSVAGFQLRVNDSNGLAYEIVPNAPVKSHNAIADILTHYSG